MNTRGKGWSRSSKMKEQMTEGLERTNSLIMREGEASKAVILSKKLKIHRKYEGSLKILKLEWTLREFTTEEQNQRFSKQ